MERKPFSAYRGTEPYVFVCYAHADAGLVYPDLVWLHERGLNLWYDEGINAGAEWREELASAIESASLILFFVSPASVKSGNCLREIGFAADQETRVLAVYLAATDIVIESQRFDREPTRSTRCSQLNAATFFANG